MALARQRPDDRGRLDAGSEAVEHAMDMAG